MSGERIELKASGRIGIAGGFNVDGTHCIVIAASDSDLKKVGERLIGRVPNSIEFREGAFISSHLMEIMDYSQREPATKEELFG